VEMPMGLFNNGLFGLTQSNNPDKASIRLAE
jgi:hypothetical protein